MQPEPFAFQPTPEGGQPSVRRVPAETGAEPEVPLLYLFGTTRTKPSRTALARKAETLYQNLDSMIARRGRECVTFTTLTHAENLTCRRESQRRFDNLRRGFLDRIGGVEWIAAVERQARGAIHYHLAVAWPWDVVSGFDFEACRAAVLAKKRGDVGDFKRLERIYFASANLALRGIWRDFRETAPKYGFGRCESLPILSPNCEALARYVGAYVGTELEGRESRDRGMRTLRYSLEHRPWALRWSFKDGGQAVWRKGCAVLAALLQTDDLTGSLGDRWAWHWRDEIGAFGRHWETCMAVVSQVSDNYTFQDRVARASRLAAAIFDHEKENPND